VDQQVYDAGSDQDQFWGVDFTPGQIQASLDETPTTHVVPFPKGIIQDSWDATGQQSAAGLQMNQLHSVDEGGVRHYVINNDAGREETTHYTTQSIVAPNQSLLASVPGQIKGSNGSSSGLLGGGGSGHGNAGGSAADVDQGYGVNNTLPEFNAGHSIRRIQHDRMPWDFTATHGEQAVPFLGRHMLVGQADFDGPDSPYFEAGQIGGAGIAVPWEGRIGDPTAYVQPPEPTVAPASSLSESPDVYAWG
jgi:hypothetical protein